MPRTPAPLTVKGLSGSRWQVFDAQGVLVAAFFSEADARAFVALPALEKALRLLLCERCAEDHLSNTQSVSCYCDCHSSRRDEENLQQSLFLIRTALAQADGPKEQP
jgi:hypothetical protein